MPRRDSSDGALHSVKFLLKQTTAQKERKWKLQCKYSCPGFSCLRSQIQSMWKQLPTRKKWHLKPKPGCARIWCSTEKQHNKVQITPANFPRNCRGNGNMHIRDVGNAQSCPILTKHAGLFNIVVFVYQIFASFPRTKSHTKHARNSCGLMCLSPGCSQPVHPVGKSHAA